MSDNKPTCTTYSNGTKEWLLNGILHREDGPAVEKANGDKVWYLNGKLHREDGPAVEWASGDKTWFLNDEKTTALEVFKRANDEQRKHMLIFYPNEFSA
jgi:hypothetical protein